MRVHLIDFRLSIIPPTQIERLKQLKDDQGHNVTHNFREVQRLNSRPLAYITDDTYFSSASSVHAAVVVFAGAIMHMTLQWFY